MSTEEEIEYNRRLTLGDKLSTMKDSFKLKIKRQKEVEIELFRVQMRHMLVGKRLAGSLITDYYANTNLRAVLEFELDDETILEPQNNEDATSSWSLTNTYAAKGTVSGYITANVVLKGLNKLEHKAMRYKKRTADTLVSLFMYLGHERKIKKDAFDAIGKSVESFRSKGDDNVTERRAAWGLKASDSLHNINMVNQRYTYVLGSEKKDPYQYQFVMALKTRKVGADDIYAKHGTLVNNDKYNVEAAGEMTVHYKQEDDSFVLCLDNDSGTFRPSIGHITRLKTILEYVFDNDEFMKQHNWKIVIASRPQLLPKQKVNDDNANSYSLSIDQIEELYNNYNLHMANSFPQAKEQRQDILDMKNS